MRSCPSLHKAIKMSNAGFCNSQSPLQPPPHPLHHSGPSDISWIVIEWMFSITIQVMSETDLSGEGGGS